MGTCIGNFNTTTRSKPSNGRNQYHCRYYTPRFRYCPCAGYFFGGYGEKPDRMGGNPFPETRKITIGKNGILRSPH